MCEPVKLHYQLHVPNHQDPELSPIILLHGTGAMHTTWSRVYRQIGDITRRKVYAIDLRNHGQSGWSEHNTLYDHEADLENFLLETQVKKCILIGHSLGGKIAMFFTLRKPHLIEKILTEEVLLSNPTDEDLAPVIGLVVSANKFKKFPKGLKERDIRDLFSRLVAEKYPNNRDFAYCTPLKKKPDGSFEFYFNLDAIERTFKDRTAFDIDFRECTKFTGTALIMYADSELIKVEEDEKIKEFFPNAELSKSNSCAHVPHVDKPEEFIKTVSVFINKT